MDDVFEQARPFLRGLAYRMLGRVTDADDILQDAWLRWRDVAHAEVREPRAFLAQVVTRLCLDHLAAARVRRECYVGQWLPEPLPDERPAAEPSTAVALADDLTFALLRLLETLTPLERAAFLLHDVFEFEFADVAAALGRSAASCRQLASRARRHVHAARPRFAVTPEDGARLCRAFAAAVAARDAAALAALFTDDVVFHADGGGIAAAVPAPVAGAAQVARVIIGFAKGYVPGTFEIAFGALNGTPAMGVYADGGTLRQVMLFETAPDGRIAACYVQRNPQKLRHLAGWRP
ncbi:MAG: RNA polymerase sigma factor SigJ [Gammaproteobacteria bacterium]